MHAIERSTTTRRLSLLSGSLYLVVVLTGMFSLLYVPSQLIVSGSAQATVQNIQNALPLFRLSIVAGMVCYVAFVMLPLVLYKLLNRVQVDAAVAMVVFAVVSVPISMLNLRHKLDIVSSLSTVGEAPRAIDAALQQQVMASLDAYRQGILIAEVFWGLWLLPFGYLAFKSGIIPRFLGVCLMLGCFGYLISVGGMVMFDSFADSAVASVISLPSGIGEIGTCLWLLFIGLRAPRRMSVAHQ